jgi:predicted metalloprotease
MFRHLTFRHLSFRGVAFRRRILLLLVSLSCVVACTPSSTQSSRKAKDKRTENTGKRRAETNDSTGATTPVPATRPKRASKEYDATLRLALKDIAQFWETQMVQVYGEQYQPIRGGIYAYSQDSTIPPCGGSPMPYLVLQKNAFYCPDSDFIAWDDQALFPKLQSEFGTFLLMIVLAHEWGHAIQQRSQDDVYGVSAEQQADCFAGAWAAHLTTGNEELRNLRDKQLDRALTGFVEFRDQVGMTSQDFGAHGTAFDRIRAFQEGFEDGAPRCAAYVDELPELIAVPFRSFKERFRGGNLPYKEVIPSTEASLSEFWQSEFGSEGFKSQTSNDLSFCSLLRSPEGFSESDMSWCFDDGIVRYNDARMRRLYDDLGDLSVGTVFAIQWAQAQQSLEGRSASGKAAYLETLCVAGAFTGSLFDPDEPENSQLSPGDMDEAVQTLLAMSSADRTTDFGTGFEQVAAFRQGVFNSATNCFSGPLPT